MHAVKMSCNPMHSLFGAQPVPYVPVRITRDSRSVHLCTSSLQNLAGPQAFFALSVSLWNDHGYPVFDGVGLAGFKSRANDFLLA